jgi:hypothetical protein
LEALSEEKLAETAAGPAPGINWLAINQVGGKQKNSF